MQKLQLFLKRLKHWLVNSNKYHDPGASRARCLEAKWAYMQKLEDEKNER